MKEDKQEEKDTTQVDEQAEKAPEEINNEQADASDADENTEDEGEEKSVEEQLQDELAEQKDKYLRLYSEFENFRRRTAKEKMNLAQTANEDLMSVLLPILDDVERAQKSFDDKKADPKALKEGLDLVFDKLKKTLEQKGLKVMETKEGSAFDPELHEAITQIPAPKDKLKGKIVDTIEKGYFLKEKVIRYAKVVTGS